jgi:hypothetical protein
MKRRQFIAATAATTTVGLAGCTQAKPTVVDASSQSGLLGPTKVDVTLENGGKAGDVEVLITVFNEQDTVLSKHRRTVQMDAGEKRQVTFEVEFKEGAKRIEVTAEPAGLF